MYSIASLVDLIWSASASGISMLNSSSNAMTISTASKLSSPKSAEKEAVGVTFFGSTLSKHFTILITLSVISFSSRGWCTPPEEKQRERGGVYLGRMAAMECGVE